MSTTIFIEDPLAEERKAAKEEIAKISKMTDEEKAEYGKRAEAELARIKERYIKVYGKEKWDKMSETLEEIDKEISKEQEL